MKKLFFTICILGLLFYSQTLIAQAPVANFRLSDSIGGFLDQIKFTNMSTGSPTSYRWSIDPPYFGMNTFAGYLIANNWSNDTVQNPVLNLFDAGTFGVCLKVTNSSGSDSICKPSSLKVVNGYSMCNGADSISPFNEGFVYDVGGPTGNYIGYLIGSSPAGFRIATCADSVILTIKRFRLLTGDTLRIRKNGHTGVIIKNLVGNNLPDSLKTFRIAGNVFFQMKATNTSTAGDSGFAIYWKATSAGIGFTVNNPMQTLTGNSFVFTDTTSISSSRSWSFGDLTGSTSLSPTKSYSGSAIYQVKLVSTRSSGCTDSATRAVNVLPDPPTTSASGLTFSSITSSSMHLAWTNGNGSSRIVIARADSTVNYPPQNGNSYSYSSVYSSGTNLGLGNKVVYNGTGNNFTVSGLNITSTYYFIVVEFNGSSSMSSYQTASYLTGNNTTLPVTLLSFNAKCGQKNSVQLNWQTASELNNDYFEIQRSVHSAQCSVNCWEVIGKVKGNGTTNVVSNYQFIDVSTPLDMTGALYYRLRQVDFDGKSTLSDVRVIILNQPNTDWNIYPNPTTNELHIETTGNEKFDVQLFDVTGKKVMDNISITNSTNINTSSLYQGIYFVRITDANGGSVITHKVSVTK